MTRRCAARFGDLPIVCRAKHTIDVKPGLRDPKQLFGGDLRRDPRAVPYLKLDPVPAGSWPSPPN
jgi:hypothetical protein